MDLSRMVKDNDPRAWEGFATNQEEFGYNSPGPHENGEGYGRRLPRSHRSLIQSTAKVSVLQELY